MVVDAFACPKRCATVVYGTPPAICSVALVWRKLCTWICGKSVFWINLWNHDVILSGCSTVPSHRVNINPVFCHLSPAFRRCSFCHLRYSHSTLMICAGAFITRSDPCVFVLSAYMPRSGKYWIFRFIDTRLFCMSISSHCKPSSSPRLRPRKIWTPVELFV